MLSFEHVFLAYRGSTVVEDITLAVASAEIVCVLGPSGCGKSTLVKAAAGLAAPTHGRVVIDGADALGYSRPIAYMPQDNELFAWLTVEKNIALWEQVSRGRSPAPQELRTSHLIEVVALEAARSKLPHELSGGMARRTTLARCLATHATIMLLDEPFTSIERDLRRRLMTSIRQWIKSRDITAIIVSHDYEEAAFMSDRVVQLSAAPGKIARIHQLDLPANRTMDLFETVEFKQNTIQLV